MPLVLASNDANANELYAWKDITGVQYHYPNGYRNLVLTGEPFVYYRGVRRATGRRGQAEYFGQGVIGEIWRDETVPLSSPKAKWAWFCSIEDYFPFEPAIPAKIDGKFFEAIKRNQWRNGVRKISESAFDRILQAGGVAIEKREEAPRVLRIELPPLDEIQIEDIARDLVLARPKTNDIRTDDPENGVPGRPGRGRRSRNSKIAGDRSEQVVIRYIREKVRGANNIKHVASEGETPGWDVEYVDTEGNLNAVEVKGTSGDAFINFELTDNELGAARRLGAHYWLFLVANCLGSAVKVHAINNPAKLIDQDILSCRPSVWRLSRC